MPLLPVPLAVLPAAAIVAAGALGVLGARVRRRSVNLTLLPHVESPDVIPSLCTDAAFVLDTVDAGDAADAVASARRIAAEQLLEAWCLRPRSAWRALGAHALQATRAEACARTASQVRLERVVAHRVPAMEAWLVRDFADTAWFSAPEDGAPLSPVIEMAARRAVTNGALALLAREWLPREDFERLTMMRVVQ